MEGLFAKIKRVLFDPSNFFKEIKDEPIDLRQFLLSYVLILAAIGPISGFIGYVILGRLFGLKLSFFGGILNLIISYVIIIAGLLVTSFIMSQLSSSLNYKKDLNEHLKLIGYALTPYWIFQISYIIPPLSLLSLIGALYSLYLLYLGAGEIVEVPKEKVIIYIVIVIVVMTILYSVINLLVSGAFISSIK